MRSKKHKYLKDFNICPVKHALPDAALIMTMIGTCCGNGLQDHLVWLSLLKVCCRELCSFPAGLSAASTLIKIDLKINLKIYQPSQERTEMHSLAPVHTIA